MIEQVTTERIEEVMRQRGYAVIPAPEVEALLGAAGAAGWEDFARSWDDLSLDRYMGDGGRYRLRRFSTLAVSRGRIRPKPAQPHLQTVAFNPLNGGIARLFDPIEARITAHPAFTALLSACDALFTRLTPERDRPAAWHVEAHQFRIEARPDVEGRPTPEGLHRDGVDWVFILLVKRQNVQSGVTTVTDLDRRPLERFTLERPMEACCLDDRRVYHGVSPILPRDAALPAYRDVLVVTFRDPDVTSDREGPASTAR